MLKIGDRGWSCGSRRGRVWVGWVGIRLLHRRDGEGEGRGGRMMMSNMGTSDGWEREIMKLV